MDGWLRVGRAMSTAVEHNYIIIDGESEHGDEIKGVVNCRLVSFKEISGLFSKELWNKNYFC